MSDLSTVPRCDFFMVNSARGGADARCDYPEDQKLEDYRSSRRRKELASTLL